jgi:molybdate transport system substrate-binding protein
MEHAMVRRIVLALAALVAALPVTSPARAQAPEPTLVFAAASLKNALDAALADYSKQTGREVTVSYAASSALAKQIESGAPADLFFSADLDWMDYLAERNLIEPRTRTTLLGNDLVLIASTEFSGELSIAPDFPLAEALGDGRLALAATASVPAGKYAKAALLSFGVWDSIAGKLAETENVRAALQLVARGEAPLGIVYASDARAERAVRVVGTFPAESHAPILYPVALTARAAPQAQAVLDFLTSAGAKPFFEAEGFRFVAPGS